MVKQIATSDEFDALLDEAAGKGATVVVDFTASWCGPCQRIAPAFAQMASKYPHVSFVKVDVDENEDVAVECGIQAMPTFKAFRDKKEVGMVRGAGACSDSCQHSFRPSSTQCLSLHSCLFADESSLEELVVKHQGDKWSTTGQGQTLGGAEVAQSEMSEREKRLAALEKRGL
mmetsp:Transcript_30620/g.89636  ORF Transcript_30620/g.89636 Transcript_30620/m.89636 type:complete len:173 (+) Transcript_30620:1283-1801(+)